MLVNIETFFFDTCWNAESVGEAYALEYYKAHRGRPESYGECAEKLSAEKAPTGTEKEAFFHRKQSCENSAEESADAVNR